MRKVIITIPARRGSKRLKNKNFLLIAGKPMWQYSVEAALSSKVTDHVYFLSDDAAACAAAIELGAKSILLPLEMAGDLTGVARASLYAIDLLQETENQMFDDLIVCQASSPLRSAEDINSAYKKFVTSGADTCVTVSEVDPHYFHWAGAENSETHKWGMYFGGEFLKKRQELPTITFPTGAVKISRLEFLREHGNFFTQNTVSYTVPSSRSLHIATKHDFHVAKNLIEHPLDSEKEKSDIISEKCGLEKSGSLDVDTFEGMKVLVVGTGSIGAKHVKNLVALGVHVSITDLIVDRAQSLAQEYKCNFVRSGEFEYTQFDSVFVCTPTHTHVKIAYSVVEAGVPVFIEKPVSVACDNNLLKLVKLSEEKKSLIMVGCNMRFHPAILKMKELLDNSSFGKVYSASAQFGHYLPQWRTCDYRETYSALAAQGGGIILECIHEFDYLLWFFGSVKSVYAISATVSDLEIDCEDIAEVILEFDSGVIVNVHMDYLQLRKRRGLEIIGSNITAVWESQSKNPEQVYFSLYSNNSENGVEEVDVEACEDMYLEEAKYFLKKVKEFSRLEYKEDIAIYNSISHAKNVLQLLEAIKESATTENKVLINNG
ncbi:hypothetical protein CL619_02050 [archaeon]|nr:hypothetical protein [archaeon]|tara:strand:- start:2195 stop:4000 length:1806 start_codon:yes stop_codon:yes gene_type:complete